MPTNNPRSTIGTVTNGLDGACTASADPYTYNDDGEGHHDHPNQRQGRLSSRQSGVEEGDARDHNQDHAGRYYDEGLVSGLIPLVQVFGG